MNSQNFFHWIDLPLVQHKLTLMRRKDVSTNSFRTLLNELSMLMTYEVTHDMEVSTGMLMSLSLSGAVKPCQ